MTMDDPALRRRDGGPLSLLSESWRAIMHRQPVESPFGEFVRYGVASAIALAADFTTLVLLTELAGVYYLVSATVSFSIGIVITYVLSVRWAFSRRRLAGSSAEQVIFVAIGVGGLVINDIVMFVLTEIALLPYAVSKIGSTGVVFAFNFFLRKTLLFTVSAASRG